MEIPKELSDFNDLNTVLNKMLQLKKSQNRINIYKVILLIFGCLAVLALLIALCFIFYKNQFSFESLLSLLLAFFSIFISIFFYFKADETSNRFYETSYNFMKDVSVTLGKIEERFGEKLNTLNDKVSHLTIAKEEKKEELENVEDEKQKMLNELMEKAKLDASQKEEYTEKLKIKDKQIADLQQELTRMKHIERNIRYERNMLAHNGIFGNYIDMFSKEELRMIQRGPLSSLPFSIKRKLESLNMIDSYGNLTSFGFELLKHNLD